MPPMRTHTWIARALYGMVVLTGCAQRTPAPQAAEDWYRQPKLFASFDVDAADLSLVNAYLLELACYIGDRGTFEVDRTLQTWGFDRRRDFRDIRTSTYGYVASDERMVLVTFGGTDFMNVRDLLSDVDALQLVHDRRYGATPEARVHRGFRDSLNSVIDGVIDEVRAQAATRVMSTAPGAGLDAAPGAAPAPKKLFVAGHSRGGAFAVLAAAAIAEARARDNSIPEIGGVYTFGQPRVGNGPFVNEFASLGVPLFRFINRADPIPEVPPAGMLPQRLGAARLGEALGYRHGGVAIRLRSDGRVVRAIDETAAMPNLNSTAGINDHYQPGYHAALYRALTDPQLIEEPTWRATVSGERVSALPRPAK